MGILYRQEQFATKVDFKVLSLGVRTQLDHLDQKVSRFEVRMTAEIADLKVTMQGNSEHCKNEFSSLRADLAVLTNSYKYVLWIGGVLATMCMSFFGLCLSILIPTLK